LFLTKITVISAALLLLAIILVSSCLCTNNIFREQQTAQAQPYIQTMKYRNLVIDLGNGLKSKAQLTLPVIGKGPFPGVLLVHGSGPADMNEHVNKNTAPFLQISQYLSERGFAVLRYDKRGIGANRTILDKNVWGNVTFSNLKQDAEKALAVLIKQPEVDPQEITIIGHSEGTLIAPRVAIDNATKVKNIVLMDVFAQNARDGLYFQRVSIPLLYAEKVLDHNHDGLISVSEASKNPTFNSLAANFTLVLETINASGTKRQLNPQYNTNKDTYISINNELKPKLIAQVESISVVTSGKKCTGNICPIWVKSQYALEPTFNIIGNVPSTTSILIQQGQNDSQTPIQQAYLLQQALTDKRHPAHTLITYPNLGHFFYPSSEWKTAFGPIQPYVLADLYTWLESHSGFTHIATPISSSNVSSSSPTTR
jgi:uncharacterized protein